MSCALVLTVMGYYLTNCGDCRAALNTSNHLVIICNNIPQILSATEYHNDTTTNMPATTTATTTGAQYSHSPTTTTQVPVYTTTPSQNLRGYSPHPDVQSTTSTSELITTTLVYPETSTAAANKTELALIYTKQQKVETEESLTGLWVTLAALGFFAILTVAIMKNKRGKLRRQSSVIPEVDRSLKSQNSWVQSAKAQDILVQMDRVPKEHRKSMEAIRKQIHTKPPPPRVARQKLDGKKHLRHQVMKLRALKSASINKATKPTNERVEVK